MNPINTILVPAFFCLIACSETPPPIAKELPGDSSEINTPWDGTYYGSQGDYFLNKASGEPLVINGQKVPVPGSTFIFELNGLDVQVYQRADDDTMENGFGYYIGTCLETAQSESSAQLSCTCKEQSSSTTSEPPFVLSINLVDGSMVVSGNFGPEFYVAIPAQPSNAGPIKSNLEFTSLTGLWANDCTRDEQGYLDTKYFFELNEFEGLFNISGYEWGGEIIQMQQASDAFTMVYNNESPYEGNLPIMEVTLTLIDSETCVISGFQSIEFKKCNS
jgi:hypothetical protein